MSTVRNNEIRMKHPLLTSLLLLPAILLAGCEFGPDYAVPTVSVPEKFKENYGKWQVAQPDDQIDRGHWWGIYNDPVLDNLEKQVDISNQNLKAAEAGWRQARAVVEEARSGLFPTVSTDASKTRTGGGSVKGGPITTYDLNVGASWVPDLWGRIRRTIESDVASAQASAADIALARLTAQADLAADYFTMRALDEQKYLLDLTVVDDRKAYTIVKNQYDSGVAAKADVLTAQTQVESVQAQAVNTGVQRAQLEHAIAVLIGKPPADLTIIAAPLAKKIPAVPVALPSKLLERRPDIAASERQVAAANAQIGVAIAAYFPDLTLSASYGYTGMSLGNLISAPNSIWSFGPALAETIFDAGLRDAQVEAARATNEQTVANYRQTVLTGFQQVEDQLAALRILEQQSKMEIRVVADARKAEELELNQYKAGTVPYNSVLTAQIATLSNELTALTVHENRFLATVSLIEALGGGWSASELAAGGNPTKEPQAPETAQKTDAAATVAPPKTTDIAADQSEPVAKVYNFGRTD